MSKVPNRDWAEDDDDEPQALPTPEVTKNADGTETHVTYRWREDGKKVKTTRIIKKTVLKKQVDPRVAERRGWAKFGAAAKDGAGPQSATTSIGEDIQLYPRQGYKNAQAEDAEAVKAKAARQEALGKASVKCRLCSGDHFTARCPYKATMAPDGEPQLADPVADPMAEMGAIGGAAGGGKSSYIPPALRKGAGASAGEKMGGKYERDDLATLRVTNVSEYAEEQELRSLFERFGHVNRVFLAKDRDTQRAKGFAFVSFADRSDAAKACAKMDGFGYNNLILRVEFAKKAT